MVNVYLRRRKKLVMVYTKRRRGFLDGKQGPSTPHFSQEISAEKEQFLNTGLFCRVKDFLDTGFVGGTPATFTLEKSLVYTRRTRRFIDGQQRQCPPQSSREEVQNNELISSVKDLVDTGFVGATPDNSEVKFQSHGTVISSKPGDDIVLNTMRNLPENVPNNAQIRAGNKKINNDNLVSVLQQLTSTLSFQRRPRSARKASSSDSRRRVTIECAAYDTSKSMASPFGALASTSVYCGIIPKTPIKEDKKSKLTPKGILLDVPRLLSTGLLEGVFVKYRKDNVELQGALTNSGIQCGCSVCNFKQVVSSLDFEKHADSKSNNQDDHIFFENGKSLYGLTKELQNVSLGSLGGVILEKIGYQANIDYNTWKGNPKVNNTKSVSTNQKQFSDLFHVLQASLNFPKGPRSARGNKPPPGVISNISRKPSRQLSFCDDDPLHTPAQKKLGLDLMPSKESVTLMASSALASSNSYQAKVGDFLLQNPENIHSSALIGQSEVNMPNMYTPGTPLCSVSRLVATGLLEGVSVNYNKDELKGSFDKLESSLQETSIVDGKIKLTDLLIHHKSSSEERSRLPTSENNLSLPSRNVRKLDLLGQARQNMKHREQDIHQYIFELLNDGSKLSYRSHGEEVLTGYKIGKNILCSCCDVLVTPSKFEAHAGYERKKKPYHSIYTSYGKSLHQIAMFLLHENSVEQSNKDRIMACKAGGGLPQNLRYAHAYNAGESCPSVCGSFSFCMGRKFLAPCNLAPCNSGSCVLCRDSDSTLNFGNICDSTILFCSQCSRMFHVGCLRHHGICDIERWPCPPDIWLCGNNCSKVHADLLHFIHSGPRTVPESHLSSLRSCSGGSISREETEVDVRWQLLSGRFQGDEGKSLLEQATEIFREAFYAVYKGHRDVLSTMVKGERGVAEFFGGMFCAVLTVKSIIVSAALIRVFGNHVAELPLAVTSKERQEEGYFKTLFLKIEEMLSFMKVENLILPADDDSLPMWVKKFGFTKLNKDEIMEYRMKHRIVTFEKTTMLKKSVTSAHTRMICTAEG